ncbi:MAG: thiamine phosphate synthase [Prevotella sp.]
MESNAKQSHYVVTLTIAGSDPVAGAGIQADIKTMSALGCYAASAITAVTVQDTVNVHAVHPVPPDIVTAQIRAVMDDLHPRAIKIGMVNDEQTIVAIAEALPHHGIIPIVIDPILVATGGTPLLQDKAYGALCTRLLPLATLITPNIPEAERLARMQITDEASMDRAAAEIIRCTGCPWILIKGGHRQGMKTDVLYGDGQRYVFSSPPVETRNTHGTGCTLSSAITAFLAQQYAMEQAVAMAKTFVDEALHAGGDVCAGNGHGPLNHFFHPRPLLTDSWRSAFPCQFITHANDRHSYEQGALMALQGGCRWIQLRMKQASDDEVAQTAKVLMPLCRKAGAVFLLDDRVELARDLGADGVHLGKNDMSVSQARQVLGADSIIGGTANTFEDIQNLHRQGADYIGCGPFRFTQTKQKLAPTLGIEGYRTLLNQMCQAGISLPLVGIGGITCEDIPALMALGIDGIALSGSVLNAPQPAEEMRRVQHAIFQNLHQEALSRYSRTIIKPQSIHHEQ